MNRYWLSWWQPGGDYRPLSYPPNIAILGWWNSGSRGVCGEESSICALVIANNQKAAIGAIQIDWPEAVEFRFVNEVADGWRPNDRFLLSDWMIPRINAVCK